VVKQLFGLHETHERDGANAISGATNPELSSSLSLTFFLSRACSARRMRRRKRRRKRRRRRTLWMILVSKWMHNGSI
jgi:hypothetical protein